MPILPLSGISSQEQRNISTYNCLRIWKCHLVVEVVVQVATAETMVIQLTYLFFCHFVFNMVSIS